MTESEIYHQPVRCNDEYLCCDDLLLYFLLKEPFFLSTPGVYGQK